MSMIIAAGAGVLRNNCMAHVGVILCTDRGDLSQTPKSREYGACRACASYAASGFTERPTLT